MEKDIDPKKTFYQIGDLYYPQLDIDMEINQVMQANLQHIVDKNLKNPRRAVRKVLALQNSDARKQVWKKALELVEKRHIGISLKELGPDCTIIKQEKEAKELA